MTIVNWEKGLTAPARIEALRDALDDPDLGVRADARESFMREVTGSGLRSGERLVLLVMAMLIDPDTGQIPDDRRPTARVLATGSGQTDATVRRQLADLVEDGWLLRVHGTRAAGATYQIAPVP